MKKSHISGDISFNNPQTFDHFKTENLLLRRPSHQWREVVDNRGTTTVRLVIARQRIEPELIELNEWIKSATIESV